LVIIIAGKNKNIDYRTKFTSYKENGIIAVLILFSLVPTIINWKETIFPIRFMVIFIFLYLGGSVLGSAETRMFTVAVPILLFWITFIVQRTVRVNLRFTKR